MDYLLTHDTEEFATMWVDVHSRGPGWRKRLKQGFEAISALHPECDFAARMDRGSQ